LAIRIGKTYDTLFRDERLGSALKDCGLGNCGSQFEHGDLFDVESREMKNANGNRPIAFPIPQFDVFPLLRLELHSLSHMRCGDDQPRREKPTGAANPNDAGLPFALFLVEFPCNAHRRVDEH
jgi:hypothetical protein